MFLRLPQSLALLALTVSGTALAQDPPGTVPITQSGPQAQPGARYTLNGVYTIDQLVRFFAQEFEKAILVDDSRSLQDSIEFISRSKVSYSEFYQAFVMGLEAKGYSTYEIGGITHIVKNDVSAQSPIRVGEGGDIPATATYVTQIIPLANVNVSDVSQVVSTLSSADAKVIAYAPTNTLIITDSAYNLRKVYDVLQRLDVAAPRSSLRVIALSHASASEVAQIIEQLYGTAQSGRQDTTAATTAADRAAARRRRREEAAAAADAAPAAASGTGVTAGQETSFIGKVLSDERTNSLIVLANEEGHAAIDEIIREIDVDVDLSSRSQIHVVYLQHAKAEEVASVLSNLSQSGSNSQTQSRGTAATRRARATEAAAGADGAASAADGADEAGGVLAAFDSGMRITADENTNSLVIIATNDDFRIVKSVIERLDIRRRQVFVDAVILEVASEDTNSLQLGMHGPNPLASYAGEGFDPATDPIGVLSTQMGGSSARLSSLASIGQTGVDLISGLAVGVFGRSISVPVTVGSTTQNISIPAFGVVLSALKTNSLVHIVSSPSLTTLDNEEAEIVVGRRVPFPTSSQVSSLGTPIFSVQREDVATTLKVTPRINSSDEVTLELTVEVSDIEEDDQGLNVAQSGFITSKREVKTHALVGNNQTMVLGGLVGTTETVVETKIPILGDLPLIGTLFRGQRTQARRSNMIVFLTPHIIDDSEDMAEIMRIKVAQREEFLRRFYGKSQEEQTQALQELLGYSMNWPNEVSAYREQINVPVDEGGLIPLDDDTVGAIEDALAVPVEPAPLEPAADEGPQPDTTVGAP
jgi:general secretion pathway protein D